MRPAVFCMALLLPALAGADSEVKKSRVANKTTYLAKSRLADGSVWDVRWSDDYAIAGSRVIYVEKAWDETESSFAGKVLSIVGPYISYQMFSDGYTEGAAHPWSHVTFETKHMGTGEVVELTEIFSEAAILEALLADSVIRRALEGQPPESLGELFDRVDGGCEFNLSQRSLTSFAFHHIQEDKIAVRLGLSHGCEVQRGSFTQLGLALDIPSELREASRSAASRGLLMDELMQLSY
ncbi:MAG: hypothetical protein AAF560_10855 [Acidobacteriota bacterium]